MFFFIPSQYLGSLQLKCFFWSTGALNQGETKVPRCLEKLKYLSIFTGTSWAVKGREEKPPKQTYVSRENVTWQTDLLHLSSGKVHPRLCHMAWVVTVLPSQITGTRGGLWNGSPGRSLKFSPFFSLFSFYCFSSHSPYLYVSLPLSLFQFKAVFRISIMDIDLIIWWAPWNQ